MFFDVRGIVHSEFLLQGQTINQQVDKALSIQLFLTERNITALELLPYSSDLTLCDIFLFLKLKGIIKGTCFW